MEFKDRLRKAMYKRKMSCTELSKLTGISASSISLYRTGKCTPKRQSLHIIANALNVSEAWLMDIEDVLPDNTSPPEQEGNRTSISSTDKCYIQRGSGAAWKTITIRSDHFYEIQNLAGRSAMSAHAIVDKLLDFALQHVELI